MSSLVALGVVYETETVWLAPFSVIAPPSVTGTIVPPEIVLPLVSTFHIAALSTAAPFPAESGRTCALNVQVPAGNVTPALESTVHPEHDGGIGGLVALTFEFCTEDVKLVAGTNGAQPVVEAGTRVSASGSGAPVVDVFVSVYVVVGPAFVPT